jgi:class 3 adenylate cyclase
MLARPGEICVSRNLYNQVKTKVGFAFEDLGQHRVKNIAEAVTVYLRCDRGVETSCPWRNLPHGTRFN